MLRAREECDCANWLTLIRNLATPGSLLSNRFRNRRRSRLAGTRGRRGSAQRNVEALEERALLSSVTPDVFTLESSALYGPFDVRSENGPEEPFGGVWPVTFAGATQLEATGRGRLIEADDFVPVDTAKTYALSGWFKPGDDFLTRWGSAWLKIGSYDVDHQPIEQVHVMRHSNARDTTLRLHLNPGDTTIHLSSTSGWNNTQSGNRALAWYGYTDSTGHTWPDYTYTRNVATGGNDGLWDQGAINFSADTIDLREPWSGPALAAGTAVRNARITFNSDTEHIRWGVVAQFPNNFSQWSWDFYAAAFGNGEFSNGSDNWQFRPGTAYVKPVIELSNVVGSVERYARWRDVVIEEIPAGDERDFTGFQDHEGAAREYVFPEVVDLSSVSGNEPSRQLTLPAQRPDLESYLWTEELVRVDPDERYELSAWTFSPNDVFNQPFGFASLDADRRLIHPLHVSKFEGAADTVLLTELSQGATSFLIADGTGWSNEFGAPAETRSLAWYGYTNTAGHTYDDYTYTRNTRFDFDHGFWDAGAITHFPDGSARIDLREPWAGSTVVPAGTAVRNATGGDVFNELPILPSVLDYQWGEYSAVVGGGVWQNGQADPFAFRPGTEFIQPTMIAATNWADVRIVPERSKLIDGPLEGTFDGRDYVTLDRSLQIAERDDLIPVDTSLSYEISADAVIGADLNTGATSQDVHSIGFTSYDVDGNQILPVHVARYAPATDTTLAATLNPGDTQLVLNDAAGWSESPLAVTRALAWFGYTDGSGHTWDDYTYTRNVAFDEINGVWDPDAINGNIITLNRPWTGPTIPAGTAVRNTVDGDVLNHTALSRGSVTDAWTTFTGTVAGTWQNGVPDPHKFRPGTAAIRLAAQANQATPVGDDTLTIRNVTLGRSDVTFDQASVGATDRITATLDVSANDMAGYDLLGTTQPSFGTASVVFDATLGRDVVRYVSDPWFVGTDSLAYTARHSTTGAEHVASVTIHVHGTNVGQNAALDATIAAQANVLVGNVPPAANFRHIRDENYDIGPGETLVADGVSEHTVLENENDSDHRIIAKLMQGPEHGIVRFNYDGTFEFTPNDGFIGTDIIRYATFDGLNAEPGVAVINVQPSDNRLLRRRLNDLGIGFHNFHDTHQRFTFDGQENPSYFDADGNPHLSWRVHLLPFLGWVELYQQFNLDEPWDSPNNLPLLDRMPDVFRSPGDSPGTTTTRFQVISADPDTATHGFAWFWRNYFGRTAGPRIRDIVDGAANSILAIHSASESAVPWTKPVDIVFDPNDPLASLGTLDRIDAVMGDASAISLSADIDPATFTGLVSIAGHNATGSLAEVVDAAGLQRADGENNVAPAFPSYGESVEDQSFKRLAIAFHNYHDTFREFPHSATPGAFHPDGTPKLSWRVLLLPYIGFANLYNEFRLDEPWDSPHNLSLLDRMPDIYRSANDPGDSTTTRVLTFTGEDAPFGNRFTNGAGVGPAYLGPRFRDFVDGASNTILFAEAGSDKAVPWTMPQDIPFDLNDPLAGLGDLSEGRIRVAMADGSLLTLGTDVAPATFSALVTMRDTPNQPDPRPDEELLYADNLRKRAHQRTRLPSSRFGRRNDLKGVGLGMHNFHDSYGQFPLPNHPNYFDSDGRPFLSWRVYLLPYLDQGPLYDQFRLDEPWDSPHNIQLLDKMPDYYRSPGDPWDSTTTRTHVLVDNGALFASANPPNIVRGGPRIRDITDGTSNTILSIEVGPDKAVPWTAPMDTTFDPNDPFGPLGDIGLDVVFAMADGSVRREPVSNLSELDLIALITRAGGEVTAGPVNPPPGITVAQSNGNTVANELGVIDSFDVVLDAPPVADVVITVVSGDQDVATVDKQTLIFTPANWNHPQSVTVAAVDDILADPFRTTTVTLSVDDGLSSDEYDSQSDQAVPVAVTNDDEPPGIPAAFDFGTDTSPVAAGFTGVDLQDLFTEAEGYGWLDNTGIESRDRGGPDDLRRDSHLIRSGLRTFSVNVPNETYEVTVTIGSTSNARDRVGVLLEDAQVTQISTAINEFRSETHRVQVIDGRLDVTVARQGATAAAINGLQIVLARPTISIDDVSVVEGAAGTTQATFTVRLTDPVPGGFTVEYATTDGTAQAADGDYDDSSGRLTFAGNAGETQTISVAVNGDTVDEPNETFFVDLSNVSHPDIRVEVPRGTGLIRDDDGPVGGFFDFGTDDSPVAAPPAFASDFDRVTPSTVFDPAFGFGWLNTAGIESRNRSGPDDLRRDYNLIRSGSRIFAVDVPNDTYEVSVTVGSQADPRDRVGIILEGTQVDQISTARNSFTTRTWAVTVTDNLLELELSRQGATAASINAVTIQPARPSISITDVAIVEGDSGTQQLVFDVSLSAAVPGGFTIDYQTADDTATAGEDYTAASGTLTFVGTVDEIQTISVDISGDTEVETNETFFVNLSNITNTTREVRIAKGQGVGSILRDDGVLNQFYFDFGTSTSPVAATPAFANDYTQVDPSTGFSTISGFGWLNASGIEARNRSGPDDLRRDYNLIRSGSRTFAAVLPNATYEVTMTVGSATDPRDRVGVLLEGSPVDVITTARGEFVTRTWRVDVIDGRLDIKLARQGATAAAVNAIGIRPALPSISIDDVTLAEGDSGTTQFEFTVSLTDPVPGGFTVDYTTVDDTTTAGTDYHTASGTLTFNGAAGETQTVTVNVIGDLEVEPNETFLVRLSNIANTSASVRLLRDEGAGLIARDDGTFDTFSFDFGTTSSPVAADFTGINETSAYNTLDGFGWLITTGIESRDRGQPDDLRRDANLIRGGSRTFAVALPDNDYNITVTVGSATDPRDRVGIILEGVQTDQITAARGTFVTRTYQASVTDGRLEIEVARQGSTAASINAIEIRPVPPPGGLAVGGLDNLFAEELGAILAAV